MTTPSAAPPTSFEGRLLAHRRLLALLLRSLPADRMAMVLDWLHERAVYHDGQEDPGAVPGPGVSLELAMAAEYAALLRMLDDPDRTRR